MTEENDAGDKSEAGLVSGFVSKLKNSGEAAFEELSSQLMESPAFLSAMRKSLEAKGTVDKTVSGAMDFMNLPSKNDVQLLREEVDGIRSRLVKQQRLLKKLDERTQRIEKLLDESAGEE